MAVREEWRYGPVRFELISLRVVLRSKWRVWEGLSTQAVLLLSGLRLREPPTFFEAL